MKQVLLALCVIVSHPCWISAQPAPSDDELLQGQINDAIERAVKYLKLVMEGDGVNDVEYGIGAKALIGWTLLESGIPPTDPMIEKIAAAVRERPDTLNTYTLSVAIIFLDRLGKKSDSLLIQSYATRLLEGQGRSGDWSYASSFELPKDEAPTLKSYHQMIAKDEKSEEAKALLLAMQRVLNVRLTHVTRRPFNLFPDIPNPDNSNTQFAVLALWVSRRHGVPVDRALQLAALHFSSTQAVDGRWSYRPNAFDNEKTMGMTCAGLIGIALGRATLPQGDLRAMLAADPAVLKGFAAVARFMKAGQPKDSDVVNHKNFIYSLWSLERSGVLYNIEKIHGQDWYRWGARLLVESQEVGGNWGGYYESHYYANTCFALLFLHRANPAKDLATKIKNSKTKIELFAPIEKGTGAKSSWLPKLKHRDVADLGPNRGCARSHSQGSSPLIFSYVA